MGRHTLNTGKALRMVRRHAWQFHGAGVMDAVRQLEGSGTVRQRTGLISGQEIRIARDRLGLPYEETAHGLTVIGWHDTEGKVFCQDHRPTGGAPLTAAGLPVDSLCHLCGGQLWDAPVPVCLCTHPYATHNVNGLCIALPGVIGCGCLGWSEATG